MRNRDVARARSAAKAQAAWRDRMARMENGFALKPRTARRARRDDDGPLEYGKDYESPFSQLSLKPKRSDRATPLMSPEWTLSTIARIYQAKLVTDDAARRRGKQRSARFDVFREFNFVRVLEIFILQRA